MRDYSVSYSSTMRDTKVAFCFFALTADLIYRFHV